MTREELSNILSAQVPSRTYSDSGEVKDESIVYFIDVDTFGVVHIYCE